MDITLEVGEQIDVATNLNPVVKVLGEGETKGKATADLDSDGSLLRIRAGQDVGVTVFELSSPAGPAGAKEKIFLNVVPKGTRNSPVYTTKGMSKELGLRAGTAGPEMRGKSRGAPGTPGAAPAQDNKLAPYSAPGEEKPDSGGGPATAAPATDRSRK